MRPFSTVTNSGFCRKKRYTVVPLAIAVPAQNKSALEFLVSKGTKALKDRSGLFPLGKFRYSRVYLR